METLFLGGNQIGRAEPHSKPRTSKKHGKGQADGGGQVSHTGKSDRECL